MMHKKMGKKGSVMLYITFMFAAILIITLASVLAPMGVLFNTKMYAAGEDLMVKANVTIAEIDDVTVRNEVYNVVDQALDASQNNIEVNAAIFQYGWVFVLVITGLVTFIYARRLVEFGGGIV